MTDETPSQTLVTMPKIEFKPKYISEDLSPKYETSLSACFDLRADISHFIVVGDSPAVVVIPTGVYLSQTEGKQMALMADSVRLKLRIEEKSSLAAKGWDVKAGVVDADYPQEIKVILRLPAGSALNTGDRIAQASWEMVFVALGVETREVERVGGFGSTSEPLGNT